MVYEQKLCLQPLGSIPTAKDDTLWQMGAGTLNPRYLGRWTMCKRKPRSDTETLTSTRPTPASHMNEKINWHYLNHVDFFCYVQPNLIWTNATIKWMLLIYIYTDQMWVQDPLCSLGSPAVTMLPDHSSYNKKLKWILGKSPQFIYIKFTSATLKSLHKGSQEEHHTNTIETHLQYPHSPKMGSISLSLGRMKTLELTIAVW